MERTPIMLPRWTQRGNQSALSVAKSVTIITTTPVVSTSAGVLDSTFGTNGLATGTTGSVAAMAEQSDGKIVIAGTYAAGNTLNEGIQLERFNSNGTVDTTFGTNGIVHTLISNGVIATGVAIQSDGKIVISGGVFTGTAQAYSSAGLIARYTSSGVLDTTFGSGGEFIVPFSDGPIGTLNGVVIQPDGRIAAVGNGDVGTYAGVAFVRVNTNGTLDTTFNGTGWTVVNEYGGPVPMWAPPSPFSRTGKLSPRVILPVPPIPNSMPASCDSTPTARWIQPSAPADG